VVFSAQEGAGVQSVWKGFLGFDPTSPTNQVNCTDPTSSPPSGCVGPAAIGQNEDKQITNTAFTGSQLAFTKKTNPDWGGKAATTNEIKADAIYYFSYGDYSHSCALNKSGTDCGGSPLGPKTTNAIDAVNGVAPTEASILDSEFPVDHYLYNVYSNGSNTGASTSIPAATAATINYASEIGFICNPNKGGTSNIDDPVTGSSYLNEIQAAILSSGFFPLSAGAQSGTVNTTPIDEGSLDVPASQILTESGGQGTTSAAAPGYAQYAPFDTYAEVGGGNSDPLGFCITSTTDVN
jgi:hypothetical protein